MCLSPDAWSAIAAWVQAAIAFIGLYAIYKQIKHASEDVAKAAQAQQAAGFMTVLSLEVAIADARNRMFETGIEKKRAELSGDPEMTALLDLKYEAQREVYRNFLDRLCSGMLTGVLDEKQYRPEYRALIEREAKAIDGSTAHQNIADLHDKWRGA